MGVTSGLDGSSSSVSVIVLLCSCFATLLVGALLAFFLHCLYLRRQKPRIPGSPHYITSKQNPYVTVPLKEMSNNHAKRAPSFSSASSGSTGKSSSNGNGISLGTPKLFSKPMAEYETATIKRNSHSLANGHIRADLDQDKFF